MIIDSKMVLIFCLLRRIIFVAFTMELELIVTEAFRLHKGHKSIIKVVQMSSEAL